MSINILAVFRASVKAGRESFAGKMVELLEGMMSGRIVNMEVKRSPA